jgi:hypothetical protein
MYVSSDGRFRMTARRPNLSVTFNKRNALHYFHSWHLASKSSIIDCYCLFPFLLKVLCRQKSELLQSQVPVPWVSRLDLPFHSNRARATRNRRHPATTEHSPSLTSVKRFKHPLLQRSAVFRLFSLDGKHFAARELASRLCLMMHSSNYRTMLCL